MDRRLGSGQESQLWSGATEGSFIGASPMSVAPDGQTLVYRDSGISGSELLARGWETPLRRGCWCARRAVTREGGNQPRWNPGGGELFFQALDNTLTAVLVGTRGGSFSVGAPERLFQIVEFSGWTYTVAPDGDRFLVREPLVEKNASPLMILTDWTSLLSPRS